MSYIDFDKTKLVNLEYSLSKELIRSNRAGSYASTTILGCNTRKYHGLLVSPLEQLDGERHVLLSSLDETIIQHNKEFRMGIHKYAGNIYEPHGHRYIRDFEIDPIPSTTYRVGGVILKKEIVLTQNEERVLIKYTLIDAHSATTIRLNPFLAFRNIHKLSKSNLYVQKKCIEIKNGIKTKLYDGYPFLSLQLSKKNEFIKVPHWYYDIEYFEEQKRGYEYKEDLYVPGYFEFDIKKGESVIFSAGLSEIPTHTLKQRFNKEIKNRIPRDSFENNLKNSAQQFILNKGKDTEILAGFPWFGSWARDTFISLPGLTLSVGDVKTCKSVLDTMTKKLKGSLFLNTGADIKKNYNSVDAPLWYFWAIQQYHQEIESAEKIWENYGKSMKQILKGYKNGIEYNIKMHENSLIFAGEAGHAITWMDAIVNGKAVTPRIGFAVEINALWYNAIMFALEIAESVNDTEFVNEWVDLPAKIKASFVSIFWNNEKAYLADFVNGDYKNWDVRPNQIFATSLKYSPITNEIKNAVLNIVESDLLTVKGLRSLSPKNLSYKGRCKGDLSSRDLAYHQGTIWPWLFGHFAEAYLKLHEKSGLRLIERLLDGFEDEMSQHGIGSISEIYDGDPPHKARGTISQAWSVAEILRIKQLVKKYK